MSSEEAYINMLERCLGQSKDSFKLVSDLLDESHKLVQKLLDKIDKLEGKENEKVKI